MSLLLTGKKRLLASSRFQLLKRLEEVLDLHVAENGEKEADYKPGFSDAILAKELNVHQNLVAGNRREVFGNFSQKHLRVPRKDETIEKLQQQINELRSRIRYVETSLGIDIPSWEDKN